MNEDRLPVDDPAFRDRALMRVALAAVEIDSTDCIVSTRKLDEDGYAKVAWRIGGRSLSVRAHRLAYRLLVGPIPDGLDLDHLCPNRDCINPEHLEPVIRRTNLLRGRTVAAERASAIGLPAGSRFHRREHLRLSAGRHPPLPNV